jgi:uncharacterized protein YueI
MGGVRKRERRLFAIQRQRRLKIEKLTMRKKAKKLERFQKRKALLTAIPLAAQQQQDTITTTTATSSSSTAQVLNEETMVSSLDLTTTTATAMETEEVAMEGTAEEALSPPPLVDSSNRKSAEPKSGDQRVGKNGVIWKFPDRSTPYFLVYNIEVPITHRRAFFARWRKCTHRRLMCRWCAHIVQPRHVERHELKCSRRLVNCELCGREMRHDQLLKHALKTCEIRRARRDAQRKKDMASDDEESNGVQESAP